MDGVQLSPKFMLDKLKSIASSIGRFGGKFGMVLRKVFAVYLLLAVLIVIITAGMNLGASEDGETTLIDIVINHAEITDEYQGPDYDWVPKTRDLVFNMRNSGNFVYVSGSGAATDNDNAKKILQGLKDAGFTDRQCAGIMGNLQKENGGFDPNTVNSIGASGIAQWMGGRLNALKQMAESQNKQWNDLDAQVAYLASEFKNPGSFTTGYDKFSGSSSIDEIAEAICMGWERPFTYAQLQTSQGDQTDLQTRKNYANSWYQYISSNTDSTDDGEDSDADSDSGTSGDAIVSYADTFVGGKYVWGGEDPGGTGADCSGFTKYVFAHFGVSLPHNAAAQANYGTKVDTPAAGDLMIWTGHVGIIDGHGGIVEAASPGEGIVHRNATNTAWGAGDFMGYYHITGISSGTGNRTVEELASTVLLAYAYANGEQYVPDDVNWDSYIACFTGQDFEGDGYDPDKDDTWQNLEKAGFPHLSDEDIEYILAIADEVHGNLSGGASSISSIEELSKYPESTVLWPGQAGNDANVIWNQIRTDSNGGANFQISPWFPQCVDVSHWLFWKTYKCDWKGGGNGNQCVSNICATYTHNGTHTPDGYWFEQSTTPVAGAIFSTGFNESAGHTGYVTKVEGGYIWYTDGNYDIPGQGEDGIGVNQKKSIASLPSSRGGWVFAVPHKG